MNPEEYQRASDLFLRACELSNDEREAFLKKECGDDESLRNAVRQMLSMDATAVDAMRTQDFVVADNDLRKRSLGDVLDGRYRLEELHATGGMGRVWRARDEVIGRDVALKELASGTAGSEQIAARFMQEAKVTGQLEHPSIVPVYEVDSEHESQPFYTMRFVKGQTLRDAARAAAKKRAAGEPIVEELRSLVTALVAVANAVGYAHSRGVIHRDLKGQNVILGDFGEVVVLDWGLACLIDEASSDDSFEPVSGSGSGNHTTAGQIIGTPAYMAPEQAAGDRDQMNALTDVYGLGAILYEILTGQAPHTGDNTPQILNDARVGTPASPRSVWRDVPRELDAICNKAMSRDQSSRYKTAMHFAADLKSWQVDEPVTAIPDPIVTRLSRWARRHKVGVASVAVLGLTAIVALSIATLVVSTEQKQTAAAQKQAEKNFEKAREAVASMLTQVGDERLNDIPQMEKLREQLLKEAVEFNEGFLTQSDYPSVRAEAAQTHIRLGDISRMMGKASDAKASYAEASSIAKKLAEDLPDNATYQSILADSYHRQAINSFDLGKVDEAQTHCEQAVAVLDKLVDRPDVADADLVLLASNQLLQGRMLDDAGKLPEAEAKYKLALDISAQLSADGAQLPHNRRKELESRSAYADLLRRTNRPKDAIREREQAREIVAETLESYPQSRTLLDAMADIHRDLFELYRSVGQRDESWKSIKGALKIDERLADEFPHIARYRSNAARAAAGVAIGFAERGDFDNAIIYFEQSATIGRALAVSFPGISTYRHQAASSVRMLGIFYYNSRQFESAEPTLLEAIGRLEALLKDTPDNPVYELDIAVTAHTLASHYMATDEIDTAIEWTQRAIQIEEKVVAAQPSYIRVRHKLSQEVRLLGELLQRKDASEPAEEAYLKAVEIQRGVVADGPDVGEHHRHLAINQQKLAEFYLDSGRYKDGLPRIEEAVKIYRRLREQQPGWFPARVELPHCEVVLGRFLAAMDEDNMAADTFESAIDAGRSIISDHPDDTNARTELGSAYEYLAKLRLKQNDRASAIKFYNAASEVYRGSIELVPEETRGRDLLRKSLLAATEVLLDSDRPKVAMDRLAEARQLPDSDDWEIQVRIAELLTQLFEVTGDRRCATDAVDELRTVFKRFELEQASILDRKSLFPLRELGEFDALRKTGLPNSP